MSLFCLNLGKMFARLWVAVFVLIPLSYYASAQPLEPIVITSEDMVVDLTNQVHYETKPQGSLSISTAPDVDGVVHRMEVISTTKDQLSYWMVFALHNSTDQQIDRLLVAPHYQFSGSGVIWPDLGRTRISAMTVSQGIRPERQSSSDADVFFITIDPGATVTYVAEMNKAPNAESTLVKIPNLQLWEQNSFKDKINSFTLFHGIVLGICGLLVLFLTILSVVRGTFLFPASAAFSWAVLGNLCIEFNFLSNIFSFTPEDIQVYRAISEISITSCLLIFVSTYLNLGRWRSHFSRGMALFLVVVAGMLVLSFQAPDYASGIARLSMVAVIAFGSVLVFGLSIQGSDRAIMLLPTWLLLTAWFVTAATVVSGGFYSELAAPALNGGLVLLILLICFTVMQRAFAGGISSLSHISEIERRALALTGSGDNVWDWDVNRDKIFTSPGIEVSLGLAEGSLGGSALLWFESIHPADRDTFRQVIDTVLAQKRGRINVEFRLHDTHGYYRWFFLRARPVVGADGEVIRCVGTLANIHEEKLAQEHLLHDSVFDNLTRLPNRELFLDRLDQLLNQVRANTLQSPLVIIIDVEMSNALENHQTVSILENILLLFSKRLTRLVSAVDTVARISSGQFGLIMTSLKDPAQTTTFLDRLKKVLREGIRVGEEEVFVNCAVGVVMQGLQNQNAQETFAQALISVLEARRSSTDRVEIYKSRSKRTLSHQARLAQDLEQAIANNEFVIYLQPIVEMKSQQLEAFEALIRWNHPQLGLILPDEFIPIAESSGYINQIGNIAIEKAIKLYHDWHSGVHPKVLPYISVNISSHQLMNLELVDKVKNCLARYQVPGEVIALELTETVIMENAELTVKIFKKLKEMGLQIFLDDFGAGYSSLSYLHRFSFNAFKIDKSLLRSHVQGVRPSLLKSTLALGDDMNMKVVVEGIETPEDIHVLEELGCKYGQGFAFGGPMPSDKARELMLRQGDHTQKGLFQRLRTAAHKISGT